MFYFRIDSYEKGNIYIQNEGSAVKMYNNTPQALRLIFFDKKKNNVYLYPSTSVIQQRTYTDVSV